MATRTKIICTIGPSVNTLEMISALIKTGMNVARINLSHGTRDTQRGMAKLVREARTRMKVPVAVMFDTKGTEIRIGKIKNKELTLPTGHKWLLVKEVVEGDLEKVTVTPSTILDQLSEGTVLLFDDGYIASHVVSISPEGVLVQIDNGGIIKSDKGVNVPNVNFDLPYLTEADADEIRFCCRENVDIIAASFVRSVEQVLAIKKILKEENHPEIFVIAKIENSEGVANFDSIVEVADGIMIARGDLGVEVPLSQVPKLQKMMLRKSYLSGKPSVTATQMLESMINNPRPTRAEASDVANAIYDGTSAVMLSGETAVGKYPLEVVQVMKKIIVETEMDFNYQAFLNQHAGLVYHDVPSAVTLTAVKTAYSCNAHMIFAFTAGGATAQLLSRLHPKIPIIAMTLNEKSYHQMALIWGVTPILGVECKTYSDAFMVMSTFALKENLVNRGDLIVMTTGSLFGVKGATNTITVESIV